MWHVGLKGDQKILEAFFREQSLFVMVNQKWTGSKVKPNIQSQN
jgi:hypothetical protein